MCLFRFALITVVLVQFLSAQEPAPQEPEGPVRQGFWRGKPIEYRVVDGQAMVDGDILLGPAEWFETPESSKTNGRFATSAVRNRFRWPDAVVVYRFDEGLRNQDRVRAAMKAWEDNTFIRFRERVDETSYVRIRSVASGCSANVGVTGGEQVVNLADGCGVGAVIHELGHTIGLWHTQSRMDRDRHVRVRLENIEKSRAFNYTQHIGDGQDIGPYDWGSIMHYGGLGFQRTTFPTLTTVPLGIPTGTSSTLSALDIQGVYRLYERPLESFLVSTFPEGLDIVVDGQTYQTPQRFEWRTGERHTIAAPSQFTRESQPNSRFSLVSWSNGRPEEQEIVVDGTERALVAFYSLQVRLRTAVVPEGAGSVHVDPPSDDGFYPLYSRVTISHVPAEGWNFLQWDPGPGGTTRLGTNFLGLSANPVPLALTADNNFYVARYTPSPVHVITSTPVGAQMTVDGETVRTPRHYVWEPGSIHVIAPAPPETRFDGAERWPFRQFSGGETEPLRFFAGSETVWYVAQFERQYRVQTQISAVVSRSAPERPSAGNNLAVSPPLENSFTPDGSTIEFSARDGSGFQFSNWIEATGGRTNPAQLKVNEQTVMVGVFISPTVLFGANVVNDATMQPSPLSPGAVIDVFGLEIGPGARLTIDDIPARVLSVATNRIRAIVPAAIRRGEAVPVRMEREGEEPRTTMVDALETSPGVYSADGTGRGTAAAWLEDGRQVSADTPAMRGQPVRFRLTGAGIEWKDRITAEICDQPASVTSATEVADAPGILEITAVVPAGCPAGDATLFGAVRGHFSRYGVTLPVAP